MTDPGARAPIAAKRGSGSSSVSSQALAVFLARALGGISTAVLTVVLARMLGTEGYGLYALALTVAGMAAIVGEAGLPGALARFLADAAGRERGVRAILLTGLRLRVLVSIAVFASLAAAAGPIARAMGHQEMAPALRAAAVALFFTDVYTTVTTAFEALREAGRGAVLSIVKSIGEFLSVLIFLALGFGVVGALAGNAVGYACAVAIGLLFLRQRLGRRSPIGPPLPTRTLMGYGGHLWVVAIAWIGFERVDQLLLGLFMDAAAVGLYNVPWRIAGLLAMVGTALAAAVGPRLASREPREAAFLLERAVRLSIVFYVVVALITAVTAAELVDTVLGPQFAGSGDVLRALFPYLAVLGMAPILSQALNYLGAGRQRKWIGLATLAVNAALDFILIPTVGLIGPAIATNVAIVVYVGGHVALCQRRLPLDLRRLALTFARALLAGAGGALACGLALAALAAAPAGVRLVMSYGVGLAVAAGALVASAELTRRDLGSLRGALHLWRATRVAASGDR